MDRLDEKDVQAAFEMMGLGTEKERAAFTRFTYSATTPEESEEFPSLDNATQTPEA
jgi:hypothetical protein